MTTKVSVRREVVKKALAICTANADAIDLRSINCTECPYKNPPCERLLLKDALTVINDLEAENKQQQELIKQIIDACAKAFYDAYRDPPCNFNNWDEYMFYHCNEYCEKNCGDSCDEKECWRHWLIATLKDQGIEV